MTYATLAEGRDEKQLQELDMLLAPTEKDRDKIQAKANMDAMKALQDQMGGAMTPPPVPLRRRG